jgi:predicted acyl esterase
MRSIFENNLAVLFLTTAAFLFKATNAFELDRNRKLELMLPTRDGVYLHTLIYLPKGADEDGAKFTAVVDRSPYGTVAVNYIK